MSKTKAEKTPKSTKRETTHPPMSKMVIHALESLGDGRKGISFPAIKKYIDSNYTVDLQKQGHHLKKFLRTAVEKKIIIQSKGTGANGRFRLPLKNIPSNLKEVVKSPAKKKLEKSVKSPVKPAASKPKSPKKAKK